MEETQRSEPQSEPAPSRFSVRAEPLSDETPSEVHEFLSIIMFQKVVFALLERFEKTWMLMIT